MKASQILSRRTERKVDFRPDPEDEKSPDAQLRRLASLLKASYIGPDNDLQDTALDQWREYLYRKIFTGTSHAEFLDVNKNDPAHIDWAIAVHEVEAENFRSQKRV